MSSVNKVVLIGNVGQDPKIRSFDNGGRVANFTVATSESWKDKTTGERKEKTEWHNVNIQNDALVSVVESYVKKGSKIYVEGKLQTRKWTDDAGVERYNTEIVLGGYNGQLVLLGGKPTGEQSEHNVGKSNAYQPQNDLDDSIEF
jgi:single-strand DNA-binding protein